MLPAKHRITKDKEYDYIFKRGRGSYSQSLGVKAAINNKDYNRYGIIIGAKVSKKATVRNRIKRQLRAIIKDQQANIAVGHDIVFICQPAVIGVDTSELNRVFVKLLRNLRLYRKK